MQKGTHTVLFMVGISVVFITVLATVNEMTKGQIERNFQLERAKKILYAFDIFPDDFSREDMSPTATTSAIPWDNQQVLQTMQDRIEEERLPIPSQMKDDIQGTFLEGKESILVFKRVNGSGEVVAYGFPLFGKGLWGTIQGIGAMSKDMQKMIGIAFTEQVETPGLGARITEKAFKTSFRQLDLSAFHEQSPERGPIVMVKDKAQTNEAYSTNSIQAITGATQTSQGVLNMVNSNMDLYIDILKAAQQ